MALAKFETKKQITIQKAIDSNLKWDNSDAKSIELDKLIGEMISLDDLPFSHVEDICFVRFVHKAALLYKLKTRKYYSEKIPPDIYESVSIIISSSIMSSSLYLPTFGQTTLLRID